MVRMNDREGPRSAPFRPAPVERLTADERTELLTLRRDVQQLRQERDILKKAAAFFAKHQA